MATSRSGRNTSTATLEKFRDQFPEFPDTVASDAVVELALATAKVLHAVRELATLYLTAHLVVLAQDVDSGTVRNTEATERKVGPLMVRYITQAETGDEAFYTSTVYGKLFTTLEKRSPRVAIGARVVGARA